MIEVFNKNWPHSLKIDEDDWCNIYIKRKWNWYKSKRSNSHYLCTKYGCHPKMIHSFILPARKGFDVDHVDGNTSNNQRYNLRYVTRSQSEMNKPKRTGNCSSKYKGVWFIKSAKKYQAEIAKDGYKVKLGRYENEIDAAMAYDTAARLIFKSFAKLNLPDDSKPLERKYMFKLNMKFDVVISLIILMFSTMFLSGAVEVDLRKGIDLTTTNVASFSILNQLVDNGTIVNTGSVTNNKGIIMRSTIRPDVTSNPRMTNWLWLDLSIGSPGTLRQYVCCGDANANWQVAALGIGSVTSTNILDYTIQAIDMATNSVPNYAIQDNAIDANKIQAQAVVAGKIGPSAVSNLNIAPSTIDGGRIALNTISNANIYDFTINSNKIAIGGIADFNIKSGGMIGSNVIAPFSLTGTNLANGAISNAQIADATITSNKLVANAINIANLGTNITVGMPKVWALVDSSGTLLKGYNVVGAARFNQGDFDVVFTNVTFTSTNYVVVGCGYSDVGQRNVTVYSNALTHVAIKIRDGTPADQDATFSVIIYDFP